MHDLLLQGDRCRGDHQPLASRLGGGDRRQTIGDGLACTGARLDRDDRGLALATPFIVGLDSAEHLGDLGDHQALAIAGLEPLGFEKTAVGALDLGLEFGAEHGRGAVYIFSTSIGRL